MNRLRYVKIIEILINYYDIDEKELIKILQIKENRYMLLLILKNYNCLLIENIKKLLKLKNNRSVLNNLSKAEEKLLINKEFRENYFELEELIEKKHKVNL